MRDASHTRSTPQINRCSFSEQSHKVAGSLFAQREGVHPALDCSGFPLLVWNFGVLRQQLSSRSAPGTNVIYWFVLFGMEYQAFGGCSSLHANIQI